MKQTKLINGHRSTYHQSNAENDSFEDLYSRYVNKVYQKCLSLTKDSDVAQDYTQDIFIKVFNKLDSFQNRSSFSTWLYSISHNYCLDQLRLNKRLNTEELSDELIHNVSEVNQTESTELRMQTIEAALDELPAEEVHFLRLKYEQGLSIKTISQQYNLSESAVKMRLKRTRDKLQELYGNRLF